MLLSNSIHLHSIMELLCTVHFIKPKSCLQMECILVRFYEMGDISTTTTYMHFILISSDIYNKLHKSSAASNPQTPHQPKRTTKIVSFHLWGTWIPISFLWNTRMPANFDLILNHNQIKIYLKSRKVCVIFTIIVIQSRSLVEVGNCELLHTTILRISDLYFLFLWSLKSSKCQGSNSSMYRPFIINVLHNVIQNTCNVSFSCHYDINLFSPTGRMCQTSPHTMSSQYNPFP